MGTWSFSSATQQVWCKGLGGNCRGQAAQTLPATSSCEVCVIPVMDDSAATAQRFPSSAEALMV